MGNLRVILETGAESFCAAQVRETCPNSNKGSECFRGVGCSGRKLASVSAFGLDVAVGGMDAYSHCVVTSSSTRNRNLRFS